MATTAVHRAWDTERLAKMLFGFVVEAVLIGTFLGTTLFAG